MVWIHCISDWSKVCSVFVILIACKRINYPSMHSEKWWKCCVSKLTKKCTIILAKNIMKYLENSRRLFNHVSCILMQLFLFFSFVGNDFAERLKNHNNPDAVCILIYFKFFLFLTLFNWFMKYLTNFSTQIFRPFCLRKLFQDFLHFFRQWNAKRKLSHDMGELIFTKLCVQKVLFCLWGNRYFSRHYSVNFTAEFL